MLKIAELNNILEDLASGKIEQEFKCADSTQKGEILEFLEKLMDAGELADEVATRLIYRGLPTLKS